MLFEMFLYLVIYCGAAIAVYVIYLRSKKKKAAGAVAKSEPVSKPVPKFTLPEPKVASPNQPLGAPSGPTPDPASGPPSGSRPKFALPSLKLPLSKKRPAPAPAVNERNSADVALARFRAMITAKAEKSTSPAWVTSPGRAKAELAHADGETLERERPAAESFAALPAPVQAAPAPVATPAPAGSPERYEAEIDAAPRIGVVLRRQVPLKTGAPRSWLGGLPMMPTGFDWPTGSEHPLHFVAQIACEDLPADLWNGLGPRTGWLLFFLNPNDHLEAKSTFRVLHTPELGKERAAPEGLGPVNDGSFADYDHDFMANADKPSVWMRWPVDIVEVPAEVYKNEGRSSATPPGFAAQLYPDSEIMGDGSRYSAEPFAIGCLIEPLRQAVEKLRGPDTAPYEKQAAKDFERLEHVGGPQKLVTEKIERVEKSRNNLAALEGQADNPDADANIGKRIEYLTAHIAHEEADLAHLQQIVEAHPTSDAFIGFLRNQHEQILTWRTETADELSILAGHWSSKPPETPLSTTETDQFTYDMKQLSRDRWILRSGGEGHLIAENVPLTAHDYLKNITGKASAHFAVESYLASQSDLLGDERLAQLEPWLRRLYKNMPHRMGGYHDGIQSDAEPGQQPAALLLQLACDDPLYWTWGDSGGVYFWINHRALAESRFDEAQCELESC